MKRLNKIYIDLLRRKYCRVHFLSYFSHSVLLLLFLGGKNTRLLSHIIPLYTLSSATFSLHFISFAIYRRLCFNIFFHSFSVCDCMLWISGIDCRWALITRWICSCKATQHFRTMKACEWTSAFSDLMRLPCKSNLLKFYLNYSFSFDYLARFTIIISIFLFSVNFTFGIVHQLLTLQCRFLQFHSAIRSTAISPPESRSKCEEPHSDFFFSQFYSEKSEKKNTRNIFGAQSPSLHKRTLSVLWVHIGRGARRVKFVYRWQ